MCKLKARYFSTLTLSEIAEHLVCKKLLPTICQGSPLGDFCIDPG